MADCYYHGDTGSGPCRQCQYNDDYGLDRGETRTVKEVVHDEMEAENEAAAAARKPLPYPGLKPRNKTNAWGNYIG